MAAVLYTILPPDIQITSANQAVPYPAIVNQLVTSLAKINKLYLQSPNNIAQLCQPISVVRTSLFGIVSQDIQTPMINMFTNPSIASVTLDLSKADIVLDGFTYLNMNMLPGASLTIVADYEETSVTQILRQGIKDYH